MEGQHGWQVRGVSQKIQLHRKYNFLWKGSIVGRYEGSLSMRCLLSSMSAFTFTSHSLLPTVHSVT